ncbi:MAG: hypothetical protein Ta2E_09710 [Mycoplasmoidaceae bacterium]|nr:MAG: hypothetical protein Ta2E_09710 [Mycoplasmoidaceae bacterium]
MEILKEKEEEKDEYVQEEFENDMMEKMFNWKEEENSYAWRAIPRIRGGHIKKLKSELKLKIEETIAILE